MHAKFLAQLYAAKVRSPACGAAAQASRSQLPDFESLTIVTEFQTKFLRLGS
jgi:hypothetical protein